jgi:hypothetical protein
LFPRYQRIRISSVLHSWSNPSISLSILTHLQKVFPNATLDNRHVLTYLDTQPPSMDIAIGTSTENPPTPQSFSENHKFLTILYDVLAKHAAQDPQLQSQAQAFAGPGGMTFGAGGAFPQQSSRRTSRSKHAAGTGGGGASAQGGAGGGGVGGYVHLSDLRNPPDFGRIAVSISILRISSLETVPGEQTLPQFCELIPFSDAKAGKRTYTALSTTN